MLVINILAIFLFNCFLEYLSVVLLKFVPHLYLGFRGTKKINGMVKFWHTLAPYGTLWHIRREFN